MADSQAKQMADTDKAFKEIGQSTNDLLSPAIKWATEMITTMSKGLAFLITGFTELHVGFKLLIAAAAALKAIVSFVVPSPTAPKSSTFNGVPSIIE
jgi:hypothetical protein